MKDSNLVFESVDLSCYSLHKITLKRGGSYIKPPEWLKNKGATIIPKSTDNKCFRDAITAALSYNEIILKKYLILCTFLINVIGRR